MGIQNIMKKITELPFQTCQHQISNMDSQPTAAGGIITCVSGFLKVRGPPPPRAGSISRPPPSAEPARRLTRPRRRSLARSLDASRPPPPRRRSQLDADANPLPFCQTFHLSPDGSNWFVANDVFRLVTM